MEFAELSPSEQQIVLQCMKAIADGPEIEDWDFQTRLGIVRPSLRRIISLWPAIDDSSETRRIPCNQQLPKRGMPWRQNDGRRMAKVVRAAEGRNNENLQQMAEAEGVLLRRHSLR
jgi:hypothetical protein